MITVHWQDVRGRLLWPAGTLALLWIALPVTLPNPSTGPAEEQCLTLPDAPPDPARMDVMAILEHCSARHPTDVELMADLGLAYERSGRSADAEAVYRRALSIDPGDGELRLRLGRLLLKRGDAKAARAEAEAGLSVQPNRQAMLDLRRDAKVP